MKKGLILNNAYSSLKTATNQSLRLKAEFESIGVDVEIKTNDFFAVAVDKGNLIGKCGEYDFCIYLDKDKYIARMLEKIGMPVFNCSKAIEECDDKMLTHIHLANCGIPMPKTLPGLLCYTPTASIKEKTILSVERELNYPLIMKESYGSLGSGVFWISDRKDLVDRMEQLKCCPHLYQEVIEPTGRDCRIIVIGGEPVAAMLRVAQSDFRSNIELGGEGRAYEMTKELRNMARKVANILELDYCGIDFLLDTDGTAYVCEVNSNAFFGKIEEITGVNIAKNYANFVTSKVYL